MATRPTYPIAVEQKTCAWRYNGALRLYQRDYIELFLYEVSLKHVASSWSTLLLDNEWLPINQHWLYGDQAGCVETTLHKARVKRNEIVEIIASKCPSRMSLIWIWRSGGPAVFSTHNLFCCGWLRLASPICSLWVLFVFLCSYETSCLCNGAPTSTFFHSSTKYHLKYTWSKFQSDDWKSFSFVDHWWSPMQCQWAIQSNAKRNIFMWPVTWRAGLVYFLAICFYIPEWLNDICGGWMLSINHVVIDSHFTGAAFTTTRLGEAYTHQWTGSSMVRVTACRLCGDKPLPEPMMTIVNWNLNNKLQLNLNQNSIDFIQESAFKNIVCNMAAILSCHVRFPGAARPERCQYVTADQSTCDHGRLMTAVESNGRALGHAWLKSPMYCCMDLA